MASQRLTIATLGGVAADIAVSRVAMCRSALPNVHATGIDEFCDAIRSNAISFPVLYFSEWIDRWLMGDLVPGPKAIDGVRFQVACFTRDSAMTWADTCGKQFKEQEWFAARLREAVSAADEISSHVVIVVMREVFAGSADDSDVLSAIKVAPSWL